MNADEYASQQAIISAAVAKYVLNLAKVFRAPRLSVTDWIGFLELLYPQIYQERLRSAEAAREFYDTERRAHYPELPRQDRFLVEYSFEEFAADMEPARVDMSREHAPDHAAGQAALRAVRNVEVGGRKQIIRAVEEDQAVEEQVRRVREDPAFLEQAGRSAPAEQPPGRLDRPKEAALRAIEETRKPARRNSSPVKGWARVATGEETCAWCIMLVSRGPVYKSALSAGLDVDDETAAEMYAAGEDVRDSMEEWHDGCDCKVVPVYDKANWPGRDAYKRAEQLWIEASNEAGDLIESGDSRTTNRNTETLNALRRRLYAGEIDPEEFAGLAA